MTSFRKFLILLSACLCAVPGIKAQGSEEDNGGSMEIVSSIHQPQPKTIDNPSKTQGDTSNVGGAHLWQSPFETHMTGDPQEMRYGWTYRINNDPSVAATYDGVPNEHFYKKLDADMNSFSPSNSGWDQNLAALNEVDPHMSTKSIKTESMPQKSAIDTAPAKDMKTTKTEIMSTVEKTEKSAPAASASQTTKSDPKTAVDTEQTKPKSSETLAKQTQAATVEIPAKQTAPIVNLQQSYQAPLSDIPDLARANAYGTCGSGIIFRQMSEQQPQQGHEQNFYLIPRQQMPMFEQTQNLPHQSIMMQPGLVPLFDQRQQVPAMDQQMAVSDQSQVPQQQSTLMPGKQMMTPEHQMSHEMRTTEERQMPMGTAVQGQEQQQQPQTFNQQLPQQQQPMLIPNQQQQMPMQAPHMPTLDQRQAFPQQQPIHNQQQQMPVQAPPMSILDQRQAFPHQLLLHNQQQQMPMQAPPMPTLDQRQAFPQQLSVHNHQQQMPMQAPPMPTLDQRQSLPQQSLFVPTHQMSDHEMRQMPQQQPMFMPPFNQQQQPAAPSDSQNFKESQIPRWNQQPTFQEQQMWPNWNIFGQRTAVTEDHMLFGKSKPGQQVPGSPDQTPQQNPMSAPNSLPAPSSLPVPNSQSATDPQPSSNVFPPTNKQEMPSQPDIFQEQTHPQPVQNFERQMPFQTLHQSNVALKDGAHDAAKPTMSTLDQGKLDEMRAIMDEMPQARTFKKFKGGIGHTVFVVPGVYGGYAGGYASPAYISPSYSAPIYGSYGHSGHSYGAHLHHGYSPYISEQNPMSKDDSTARENSKGANLQPVAGPLPEKEITFSKQTSSTKTLDAHSSMAEEDTMTTAASEDDPTIGEDLPSARGCTCRRIGSDNDDYESDNDQHVAAVPIQIHPDGSHRLSSDVVGSAVWTPGMVKPYAGLWDPKGFLGRFLKPAEPLIYQPPTVGVAYVPVQKVRSANSADNSPNRPTSWADSIRQSQEHLVGSSRAPQRTTRIRPSSRNCNRRQAPPMGRPSLLGSVIKPASTLVGATKKPPVSNPDTEPTPSATSIETVGEPQQPESSSAIEGCVRQCLKD